MRVRVPPIGPLLCGVQHQHTQAAELRVRPSEAHNLLRPEMAESLFYMWRLTHESHYRDKGWRVFMAFKQHCRLPGGGYAAVRSVVETPVVHQARLEQD